jgi:hypothetical protein
MFFGLMNSPATFQQTMDCIFQPLMNKYLDAIDVYMDDIFIKTGPDLELHREIMHKVLNLLEKESFFLKPPKCKFKQTSIDYLGIHIEKGVTVACKKNECDVKFDVQPLYNTNRDVHQEFFYICVPLTKLYSIPKIGRDFVDFEQVPVSAVVTTDSHMPRMSKNHVFTLFLYRNEQCKLISSIVPLGLVQC